MSYVNTKPLFATRQSSDKTAISSILIKSKCNSDTNVVAKKNEACADNPLLNHKRASMKYLAQPAFNNSSNFESLLMSDDEDNVAAVNNSEIFNDFDEYNQIKFE